MSIYTRNFGSSWTSRVLMARVLVALAFFLTPTIASAQMASIEQAKGDITLGSADAPVTLHEYSSLTCPHCANFHKDTLPLIKKEFIDTGKVRMIFHDFPLDGLAMGATMIARCSGERAYDFTDMLFQTQADWRDSQNPLASLIALARFYGLSGEDVKSCVGNQDLLKYVENKRDTASAQYKIQSTPSFVLNGKLIEGSQPFENFKEALDKALAAAN